MFSICIEFLTWYIFDLRFFPSWVLCCFACYLLDILCQPFRSCKMEVVFLLKYYVDEIQKFSIDFWQLLPWRVKVVNVFPWLWTCFWHLGCVTLLRNNRVFKNSQLLVELNVWGKWVDLFPAPLFSMTCFPTVKELKQVFRGKKCICFTFLTLPVKTNN